MWYDCSYGGEGKYYKVEGDAGIKHLLCLVCEEFRVLNLYVIDECEPSVSVLNIFHHTETYATIALAGTDDRRRRYYLKAKRNFLECTFIFKH